MATEILAAGTTAANSIDVTVASGSSVVVSLKGAAAHLGNVLAKGQVKDDAGAYQDTDIMLSNNKRSVVVIGPGVYRFARGLCDVAVGIFSA